MFKVGPSTRDVAVGEFNGLVGPTPQWELSDAAFGTPPPHVMAESAQLEVERISTGTDVRRGPM